MNTELQSAVDNFYRLASDPSNLQLRKSFNQILKRFNISLGDESIIRDELYSQFGEPFYSYSKTNPHLENKVCRAWEPSINTSDGCYYISCGIFIGPQPFQLSDTWRLFFHCNKLDGTATLRFSIPSTSTNAEIYFNDIPYQTFHNPHVIERIFSICNTTMRPINRNNTVFNTVIKEVLTEILGAE